MSMVSFKTKYSFMLMLLPPIVRQEIKYLNKFDKLNDNNLSINMLTL